MQIVQRLVASLFLFACASAFALDSNYQLDIGTSVRDGTLKVEPRVSGPAGKMLRYEMDVRRQGQGGSSNSSQAGTVRLDDAGKAKLAMNSVSVSPRDRYEVTVRLLDGDRVVAEDSVRQP
jgi:hypothetical protein